MLAPVRYARDLQESPLGRIINHKPADILGEAAIRKRKQTAAKWSNLFPEEPFEKELKTMIEDKNEFKSSFSYDILSASARQKIFYYQVRDEWYVDQDDVWELQFQVSLPHYTTRTFLRTAITRYAKFLFLKLKNLDQFLVPCYDIDIVWHSHQVS